MSHKVLRHGYYWPTLAHDAKQVCKKCDRCQMFANVGRQPLEELTPVFSLWPFADEGWTSLALYLKLADKLICYCGYRLLHQVDRARTPSDSHRSEDKCFHLEKHHLSIQHTLCSGD